MPHIIPSTDLRNNFADVERLAKESREPIYLTKNGRGSLVVMDVDAFEEYQGGRAYRRYIDHALEEACLHKHQGVSRYQDLEAAFVELLDETPEPLTNGARHASA